MQPTTIEPVRTAPHPPGPPGAAPGAGGAPSPGGLALTPEQLEAIGLARHQGRKIGRAASVATFSGWSMACFAGLTLLSGLFSLPALLLGIGMSVIAYIELRGARRLRRFDLGAPRQLGLNQIALGVLLFGYGLWGLLNALFGPSPYEQYLSGGGQMAEVIAPIEHLNRAIGVLFYALVILCGVFAPAGAAVYYFSRRRHLVAYLKNTPQWVIDTLRLAAG